MIRSVLTMIVISLLVTTGCSFESPSLVERTDYSSESRLMELTFFTEDLIADNFDNPVAKEIEAKTGVTLKYELPIGSVSEKIGVMMASGDYSDLIMVKDTGRLVDAGAYVDLRPLIEDYGPNIKKLYGGYFERLKYSSTDEAIYVLPAAPVDNKNWYPNSGFQLQHAVVKALGYPEIKTLDDYENAIRQYIEMYPTINGKPTIGITLLTDDWRWMVTLGNPGGFVTGKPDDGQWYIDPSTYEATYRFIRDDEKPYFEWLNHMYHSGLVDPDSFVQKYEGYENKIASGTVLGLIDSRWQFDSAQQILRLNEMEERTYGMYPVQLDDTTIAADYRDTGYLGGYGIGISVNCDDPVKAIQFLDYMASVEGQILRNWGIEGINYLVDEDGRRVVSEQEFDKRRNDPDYGENTGVGLYTYPFPRYGALVVDENGYYISAESNEVVFDGVSDAEQEVLDAYGIYTWSDLYPPAEALPESSWGVAWNISIPDDTGISEKITECDDLVKRSLINAIVASPEEFDMRWEEMQQTLIDMGAVEMGEAFTQLVRQRIEDWN